MKTKYYIFRNTKEKFDLYKQQPIESFDDFDEAFQHAGKLVEENNRSYVVVEVKTSCPIVCTDNQGYSVDSYGNPIVKSKG